MFQNDAHHLGCLRNVDLSKREEAATMMLVCAGTHRCVAGWLCSTDGLSSKASAVGRFSISDFWGGLMACQFEIHSKQLGAFCRQDMTFFCSASHWEWDKNGNLFEMQDCPDLNRKYPILILSKFDLMPVGKEKVPLLSFTFEKLHI